MRFVAPAIFFMLSVLLLTFALRFIDVDPGWSEIVDATRGVRLSGDLVVLMDPEMGTRLTDLGEGAILSEDVPNAAFTGYARILVVDRASAVIRPDAAFAGRRFERLLERTAGDWRLRVYQLHPVRGIRFDAFADLAEANVALVSDEDGAEAPCPWNGERFECPEAEWVYVGPKVDTVLGERVQCLWSHPVPGRSLRIEFPPNEGVETYGGWIALTDYAASVPGNGRSNMRVTQGGSVSQIWVRSSVQQRSITMNIPEHDRNLPLIVQFDTTSGGVRHLCWNLWGM
jgi:hypothetical protein